MTIDFTPEEAEQRLSCLREPFDLSEVKWRVAVISADRQTGLVLPYADPRAYISRLNEVFTPAGWSCAYSTQTMAGLTRTIAPGTAPVKTGKIITIATLEIFGIASKSSTGEMWADDSNAGTRAEAQAFKRAAAMFGLGQYFYRLKTAGVEMWVAIDRFNKPLEIPILPSWALPAPASPKPDPQTKAAAPVVPVATTANTAAPAEEPAQAKKPVSAVDEHSALMDSYQDELGPALYKSIVSGVDRMIAAGKITGNREDFLLRVLRDKSALLEEVRDVLSNLPVGMLEELLDRHKISDLGQLPNYGTLRSIAEELGVIKPAAKQAA